MDNPFLGCSGGCYLLDCGKRERPRTLERYDYPRTHRDISISFRRCRHSWLLVGRPAICRRSLFPLVHRIVRNRLLSSCLVVGFPRNGEWSPPSGGSLVRNHRSDQFVRLLQYGACPPQLGMAFPSYVGCIL